MMAEGGWLMAEGPRSSARSSQDLEPLKRGGFYAGCPARATTPQPLLELRSSSVTFGIAQVNLALLSLLRHLSCLRRVSCVPSVASVQRPSATYLRLPPSPGRTSNRSSCRSYTKVSSTHQRVGMVRAFSLCLTEGLARWPEGESQITENTERSPMETGCAT